VGAVGEANEGSEERGAHAKVKSTRGEHQLTLGSAVYLCTGATGRGACRQSGRSSDKKG